jgi:hypothetical protein
MLKKKKKSAWCFSSYQFVSPPLYQQTASNLVTTIALEVHAKISGKVTASTSVQKGANA